MCWETCDFILPEDGYQQEKPSFCCKNESEIAFLTVTLPCIYQYGFPAQPSQFLSNTTHFYDWVANNLTKL